MTSPCVDDYQFRNPTAQRPRQCRRFKIINEEDFSRTFYVNISQFQENGEVGLCKIILYLGTKGLQYRNKKFYLPQFNAIVDALSYCRVAFQALNIEEVLLKAYPSTASNEQIFNQEMNKNNREDINGEASHFCPMEDVDIEKKQIMRALEERGSEDVAVQKSSKMEEESGNTHENCNAMVEQLCWRMSPKQQEQASSEPHRKTKEPQRIIRQVILAVKTWRALYQYKVCSLTRAAQIVSISKKSLDDYYLVLRIGDILGFDFANNMEKKMGQLRTFINSKQEKITGKLGKEVKCFSLVEPVNPHQVMATWNSQNMV